MEKDSDKPKEEKYKPEDYIVEFFQKLKVQYERPDGSFDWDGFIYDIATRSSKQQDKWRYEAWESDCLGSMTEEIWRAWELLDYQLDIKPLLNNPKIHILFHLIDGDMALTRGIEARECSSLWSKYRKIPKDIFEQGK